MKVDLERVATMLAEIAPKKKAGEMTDAQLMFALRWCEVSAQAALAEAGREKV